jgi:hypothetical protein
MRISEVKRRARLGEWVQNIRDHQESGLTIRAWCAAHGIREARYYYWLRIVRSTAIEQAEQAEQRAMLIRVEPERLPSSVRIAPMDAENEETGITMRYGKASVEFPTGTPFAVISEMLKALDAP